MMSNFTDYGVEAEEPVIYIRYSSNTTFHWSALDTDMSCNPRICPCRAKVNLHPCFRRIESLSLRSSTAAAGSKIYTFGGYDLVNKCNSDQVSCIDMLCPKEGWKALKQMPKPLQWTYPVTIDEYRVLLVGGRLDCVSNEPTLTQLYYPKTDTWFHVVNEFQLPQMNGHGVSDDRKSILMHSYYSSALFSYDVNKNCWGFHWKTGFGESKHASALVDGIYYVLDSTSSALSQNLFFTGYVVSEEKPKCLQVEVNLEGETGDDKEWVPAVDSEGYMADSWLLSLDNSKMAMVWYYNCFDDEDLDDYYLSVHCSIFRMIKDEGAAGELKLVAQPLSKTCYHAKARVFNGLLVGYPSKYMDNLDAYRKRRIIEEENGKKRAHF